MTDSFRSTPVVPETRIDDREECDSSIAPAPIPATPPASIEKMLDRFGETTATLGHLYEKPFTQTTDEEVATAEGERDAARSALLSEWERMQEAIDAQWDVIHLCQRGAFCAGAQWRAATSNISGDEVVRAEAEKRYSVRRENPVAALSRLSTESVSPNPDER